MEPNNIIIVEYDLSRNINWKGFHFEQGFQVRV